MDITGINNVDYSSSLFEKPEKQNEKALNNSKESASQNLPKTSAKEDVNSLELSDEEKNELKDLKARDRSVRAHEAAHLHAAGKYAASAAIYSYDRGPDNRLYVVGGEVKLDADEESTPEATIEKMQVIKRAALAPIDPSAQDRIVASRAASRELKASAELTLQKAKEVAEAATNQYSDNANNSNKGRLQTLEKYSQNSFPGELFDSKK